jgi:hypothetical protein
MEQRGALPICEYMEIIFQFTDFHTDNCMSLIMPDLLPVPVVVVEIHHHKRKLDNFHFCLPIAQQLQQQLGEYTCHSDGGFG